MLNYRLFLLIAGGILLVTCMTQNIQAQQGDPNRPRPTPTPLPPIIVSPRGSILSSSETRISNQPGIFGNIRWRKELGLPYDASQVRPPYPVCNAFRVRVTVQEPGGPGTFGTTRTVADLNPAGNPKDDNGYYVCNYAIFDQGQLPHDRELVVKAELDPRVLKGRENEPWVVGAQPYSPPGYQRTIMGGRGVMLTDNVPRVTVDFEMAYQPLPQGPR